MLKIEYCFCDTWKLQEHHVSVPVCFRCNMVSACVCGLLVVVRAEIRSCLGDHMAFNAYVIYSPAFSRKKKTLAEC